MPYTSITEEKAALRREIRARMKALTPQERRDGDRQLFRRFLDLDALRDAGTVLLYCGMGAELDTAQLFQPLLQMGKTVALPRCTGVPGEMEARLYDGAVPLVRHRYGMLEPPENSPVIAPEAFDLILIPGLAFDRFCYRLGQGGGYYDRYLPRTAAVTVALCRDCFLLDAVPREGHDRPVDLVITQSGMFSAPKAQ